MLSLEYMTNLYTTYQDASTAQVEEFMIRDKAFLFNTKPAIMGVINLSHQSWYRESVCFNLDMATRRGHVLHANGADIIDIGAESTLDHTHRIDEQQQIAQILPVVRVLNLAGIISSVETYYSAVARACLTAGADIINLTGLVENKAVYQVVADFDAAVIICYMQGEHVRSLDHFNITDDPIDAMYDYFAKEIDVATKIGVKKIFIDAGLGFYYQNLNDSAMRINFQMKTFLNGFRLRKLGFPVCNALPHAFECFGEHVRDAESFFAVLAALGKTDLFRTHEVPKIKAVLDTMRLFSSL